MIVGVYATEQSIRFDDRDSATIVADAVSGALHDAGLGIHDVDGINLCIGHPENTSWSRASMSASRLLQGRPHWTGMKITAISALAEAALAVAAGHCDVVVVAAGQAGLRRTTDATPPWTRRANPFYEPWGLHTMVEWALVAQQYMARYKVDEAEFAATAATIRNHGNDNPEAIFYGRGHVTGPDVLASRIIATPLRLLDCAMASEGGAAFVVASRSVAAACRGLNIDILGIGIERMGPSFGLGRPPLLSEVGMVGASAARSAFGAAGISPLDIDLCQLYDTCSFEVLRQLEAFGFCGEGEGAAYAAEADISRAGALPVCTDGGTMSHSHPGIPATHLRVVEAVTQLRGNAKQRQIESADLCLVANGGSGHLWNDVAVLGRAR